MQMRANRGKGKIAEIQRETAECFVLMKTFCLNPSRDVFERVNKCSAVVKSEFYAIWKLFLPQYCQLTSDNMYEMKRDIAFRAMILKASEAPTKGGVMQLLYVFAATGWFPAIEKYYECMGDGRIVMSTRVVLSQEYREWKELYVLRIQELLTADPAHFTSRGIDQSVVDFSRFEIYQRDYEIRREQHAAGK